MLGGTEGGSSQSELTDKQEKAGDKKIFLKASLFLLPAAMHFDQPVTTQSTVWRKRCNLDPRKAVYVILSVDIGVLVVMRLLGTSQQGCSCTERWQTPHTNANWHKGDVLKDDSLHLSGLQLFSHEDPHQRCCCPFLIKHQDISFAQRRNNNKFEKISHNLYKE